MLIFNIIMYYWAKWEENREEQLQKKEKPLLNVIYVVIDATERTT
jgi:hypothetical protein